MTDNPARALRALVKRNKLPEQSLFAPQIFATAAGIEAHDVYEFLGDPTKLCKGLSAAQRLLESDALYSYIDAGGIVAGLGASLDTATYPPRRTAPASLADAFSDALLAQVLAQPWVAAGLEATRRLASDPLSKLILAVSLPGPASLAAQVGNADSEGLEMAGQLLVGLVRNFGEAGALLFVIDESTAELSDAAAWESSVKPVVNVMRFFQALPVLLAAADAPAVAGAMPAAVCAGIDSTTQVLSVDPSQWQAAPAGCALIITRAELAIATDFGVLRAAAARVRSTA